jgi:hypothetical protein
MISSTARDLPEHRLQVMNACLAQDMFPKMMEYLPAADADAIAASLGMVDEADVYLGIFAWRYGYVPAGYDISITEMEYNRAVERGIPRLLFLMHDDHPVRVADVETGVNADKLKALRARLGAERVVNFFKSPDDLRAQVINSLSRLNAQQVRNSAASTAAATASGDAAVAQGGGVAAGGGGVAIGGNVYGNVIVQQGTQPLPAAQGTQAAAKLTRLTGKQFGVFQTALLGAFTRESLANMVRVYLDTNLDAVAGGSNFSTEVFSLIDWAQRTGHLDALIDGALAANPGNAELQAFARSVGKLANG